MNERIYNSIELKQQVAEQRLADCDSLLDLAADALHNDLAPDAFVQLVNGLRDILDMDNGEGYLSQHLTQRRLAARLGDGAALQTLGAAAELASIVSPGPDPESGAALVLLPIQLVWARGMVREFRGTLPDVSGIESRFDRSGFLPRDCRCEVVPQLYPVKQVRRACHNLEDQRRFTEALADRILVEVDGKLSSVQAPYWGEYFLPILIRGPIANLYGDWMISGQLEAFGGRGKEAFVAKLQLAFGEMLAQQDVHATSRCLKPGIPLHAMLQMKLDRTDRELHDSVKRLVNRGAEGATRVVLRVSNLGNVKTLEVLPGNADKVGSLELCVGSDYQEVLAMIVRALYEHKIGPVQVIMIKGQQLVENGFIVNDRKTIDFEAIRNYCRDVAQRAARQKASHRARANVRPSAPVGGPGLQIHLTQ